MFGQVVASAISFGAPIDVTYVELSGLVRAVMGFRHVISSRQEIFECEPLMPLPVVCCSKFARATHEVAGIGLFLFAVNAVAVVNTLTSSVRDKFENRLLMSCQIALADESFPAARLVTCIGSVTRVVPKTLESAL